ncbi:50S ribosomal protein L17 [Candidatus Azambacteria bacterium]|nr:50S ribosomal protein L17 [Candidatus Azambacteria bacterium]
MKHLNKTRKFHRETGQRAALLKALMTALITNGKIKTTEAKAKEVRPRIEKMVSKAKVKDINTVRLIRRTFAENVTKKLFDEVAVKYKERNGGYTRIVKLGQRRSDGSEMAQIEFV